MLLNLVHNRCDRDNAADRVRRDVRAPDQFLESSVYLLFARCAREAEGGERVRVDERDARLGARGEGGRSLERK